MEISFERNKKKKKKLIFGPFSELKVCLYNGKGKSKKGRSGKWFPQRAPCKFHALGTCTKGRDCPYFHSTFKPKVPGAVAQGELDDTSASEAEPKAAAKATRNRKKKTEE